MNQLIKLQDKFILVSDEEIKEGDWYFLNTTGMHVASPTGVYKQSKEVVASKLNNLSCNTYKIIAGHGELPYVDFSLLSEEDCKTIGWVDVEKLRQTILNKYIGKLSKSGYSPEEIDKITERDWFGLWEGFQIAQSLNDKRLIEILFSYDLEIKTHLLNYPLEHSMHGKICEELSVVRNEFIQSLQQTSWDVEVNELNQITKIL